MIATDQATKLLDSLSSEHLLDRLLALNREARALRVLLRAARARERRGDPRSLRDPKGVRRAD
jgi:hypothetical protein